MRCSQLHVLFHLRGCLAATLQGTHDELMVSPRGLYRSLALAQGLETERAV
jgi:hypothetical protein